MDYYIIFLKIIIIKPFMVLFLLNADVVIVSLTVVFCVILHRQLSTQLLAQLPHLSEVGERIKVRKAVG